jgi:hypothetical protein
MWFEAGGAGEGRLDGLLGQAPSRRPGVDVEGSTRPGQGAHLAEQVEFEGLGVGLGLDGGAGLQFEHVDEFRVRDADVGHGGGRDPAHLGHPLLFHALLGEQVVERLGRGDVAGAALGVPVGGRGLGGVGRLEGGLHLVVQAVGDDALGLKPLLEHGWPFR